jgi:uncharacterized protein (TIGR01244 family)
MGVDEAYNYRAVDENVATAGLLEPEQLATLADAGIEVVINLLPDTSDYSVKDEKQIVESQSIEYLYLPVDFSAPKLEEYEQFKVLMSQAGNRKLLIHCAANYRVSAFYSRYAIESGRWSDEEADEFMYSIWQPSEYPGWPEWLEEVEHHARGS